jgi:hypothetical protein
VLEGLPPLVELTTDALRRFGRADSLAVVAYHLLGDVVNAAGHALFHYLPLNLDEPFLQNSSIGTPYQKWAKFTSDDFCRVDQCLGRLAPVAWMLYERAEGPQGMWFLTDGWPPVVRPRPT